MVIYTYPVYVYLTGKSHTFGIASKISCIFTLLVRYFMLMYVLFENIFVTLFLENVFLWAQSGFLYIHNTKTV